DEENDAARANKPLALADISAEPQDKKEDATKEDVKDADPIKALPVGGTPQRLSLRDAVTAVKAANAGRRRSLAEQFGYGVAPKNRDSNVLVQEARTDSKKSMVSGFIGVKAGDTDLLQRLAAKRIAEQS
ncbi:unnamed protein product, partial [Polarella glacialis]